jgi:hypothetical protein
MINMSRYHINRILLMLILISAIVSQPTIAGNIGTEIRDTVKTLQKASFTVISPNGGENWLRGATHTIKWSSTGNHRTNVGIELFKAGVLNRIITVSTANDGYKSWTIPSAQVAGTDYKIKIINMSNLADYDFSDNNFTISGPSITIMSPNGGENWARSTTHVIKWNSVGNTGSRVKIELFRRGTLSRTISSRTSNNGYYGWTVPLSQTLDSNYKIRITSVSNSGYYDWSNNYFRIS